MFTIKIYPNNFHVFDKDGILVFDSDYDYDEDYKDIQKVLDNMIAHYMEVIDSLGLSRVSDSGSLKRDEAWDGAEILKQEIMRLRKIESRVDKTKDGVCVFIGDEVFHPEQLDGWKCIVRGNEESDVLVTYVATSRGRDGFINNSFRCDVNECYSSKDLAIAARICSR